ncbi:phage tail protein [Paraburkholderia azotifigens]|uniref:phage tail protein n=1 Tax=Paraburkholderia azotifigens TaxID=2057004 RepID=UPI00317E72A1
MMEHTNEIRLYGNLGLMFGRRHAFVASTPRHLFNALVALKPGFAQELATSQERSIRYAVFAGRDNLVLTDLDRPLSGDPVRLVPVVAGSKADGLWLTIGGVALFSAGAISLFWANPYAYQMMGLGASLALGGVAQMISPHPPVNSPVPLPAQNVVAQGGPVPIVYGRMRVGSTLISASSTSSKADHLASEAEDRLDSPWDKKSADTLVSRTEIEIVDLISEGPIAGLVDAKNPDSCVFFNGVRLAQRKGERKFGVVEADYRNGDLKPRAINWLQTVSSETSVGIDLYADSPWNLTLNELDIDEVVVTLGVHGLYHKDGDREKRWKIECQFDISACAVGDQNVNRSSSLVFAFDGLCRHAYEETITLPLPEIGAQRYEISLQRRTREERDHFGTVYVKSYAVRRKGRLLYPMSAIAAFKMVPSGERGIPARTYDVKGMIVNVPDNYDPEARKYTGVWNGQFKLAWTDNPAWVFYDMLTNERYGAGRWIDRSSVDRYSLYAIGRYCDELVPDGRGGSEPRFTCNCHITSRTHAFALLQQMASVFRGMAYWWCGTVTSVADMPQDPVHVYVPANVIDGEFRYVGSSLKTRYTVAMVNWHDPDNGYRESVESVEDAQGVERYGAQKVEVAAFGCTSRAQAQRVGHWYLLTSLLETDTVVFGIGLDGVRAQPGQVIAICDPTRHEASAGGRVKSVPGGSIELDRSINGDALGMLRAVMPDGRVESHRVVSVNGQVVKLDEPFSVSPVAGAVWLYEAEGAKRRLFRVANVTEAEDGARLTITATQHEPDKFSQVDRSALIDFVSKPEQLIDPVRNLSANSRVERNPWRPVLDVKWDELHDAVEYEVRWCALGTSAFVCKKVSKPGLCLTYLEPGHYTLDVVATLRDGRRSQRAEVRCVLHGLAYPGDLRATRVNDTVLLTCNVKGLPNALAGVEYAFGSTAEFSKSQHSSQKRRDPFKYVASLKRGQHGFAWVRMQYTVDEREYHSEWYPPESGPGVFLPAK